MRNLLNSISAIMSAALVVLAGKHAFAADPVGEEIPVDMADAAYEAHEKSSGLPQFDPTSFPSQIFWLLIAFAILYAVFSRKTLPAISGVLQNRQQHIQADLDRAENLRREAELAQTTYEKLMEGSREEATKLITGAAEKAKKDAETKARAFQDKTVERIDETEANITKAKTEAMKDMNDLVADVASTAAQKIIGIKADKKEAANVVKSLSKKEAA